MKRFLIILILTVISQSGHAYIPETGKSVRPDMKILKKEARDGYDCNYIEFSVERKERIKAYLLIPHGAGQSSPSPAILMLHDHGARFDIGKEKLVRPICEALPDGPDHKVFSAMGRQKF